AVDEAPAGAGPHHGGRGVVGQLGRSVRELLRRAEVQQLGYRVQVGAVDVLDHQLGGALGAAEQLLGQRVVVLCGVVGVDETDRVHVAPWRYRGRGARIVDNHTNHS